MDYRNLGRSGLKVSKMSLGTNAFGARSDETTSIKIVHEAISLGINLIDTADHYQKGESERIIGLALKDRRSEVVLATKCFFSTGPGPNDVGCSRLHVFKAVEASLRRLQTDYIDLLQLHRWDPTTPLEETLDALNDLVRAGKVRYIGCSNYAAWQMVKALGISEQRGWARFISSQPEYSPLRREIEAELIPAGLSEGVGQLAFYPLAGGLLTGKYQEGQAPPAGSRAVTQGAKFTDAFLTERNFQLVRRLSEIAAGAGISLAELSLAWVMAKPGVTSAVTGASRVGQITESVKACAVDLSADLIRAVDEATA